MSAKQVELISVYAISVGEFLKFGISKDMSKRLSEIQCNCPYEAKALASINDLTLSQAGTLENAVHAALDKFHERGEWFRKCQKTLAVVELMKTKEYRQFLSIMNTWAMENVTGQALGKHLSKGLSSQGAHSDLWWQRQI